MVLPPTIVPGAAPFVVIPSTRLRRRSISTGAMRARNPGVRGIARHLTPSFPRANPGLVGTYHKVSKDYLPLYLNEFSFRFNNRNDPGILRAVIAGC
jgi:transposase-like protein